MYQLVLPSSVIVVEKRPKFALFYDIRVRLDFREFYDH